MEFGLEGLKNDSSTKSDKEKYKEFKNTSLIPNSVLRYSFKSEVR